MELHEGWRELYTLQTRPEAVKVCSLCYCCREVVPTSDGAGEKRILIYVFWSCNLFIFLLWHFNIGKIIFLSFFYGNNVVHVKTIYHMAFMNYFFITNVYWKHVKSVNIYYYFPCSYFIWLMFLPWYNWKIAHLALTTITLSITNSD